MIKWNWKANAQQRPGGKPRRHGLHPDGHAGGLHRSTKAGEYPQRHERPPRVLDHGESRSTKAGESTPATPCPCRPSGRASSASLNEGRGINPGDTGPDWPRGDLPPYAQRRPGNQPRRHRNAGSAEAAAEDAQRRPGNQPRRHPRVLAIGGVGEVRSTKAGESSPATLSPLRFLPRELKRSTKAGESTPATPRRVRRRTGRDCTLNEGRGINPGDTWTRSMFSRICRSAQRRPGNQPRRHVLEGLQHPHVQAAQRRPGNQPRRHKRWATDSMYWSKRSTKAGESTPATPATTGPPWSGEPSLNEGRGINPGDTAPLDQGRNRRLALNEGRGINPGDTCTRFPRRAGRTALNEGRGINPGDTRQGPRCQGVLRRSTKAGESTPATRPDPVVAGGAPDRSTKAGESTPATPVLAYLPVQHQLRSTKAGESTPATPLIEPVDLRGIPSAQRRPGNQPRRHDRPADRQRPARQRSTKAGESTPATLAGLPSVKLGCHTAQRRPGNQPRRHERITFRSSLVGNAQRRPGNQPRRHPPPRRCRESAQGPLNEGRGINPGDTDETVATEKHVDLAQRRPGNQPRRHLRVRDQIPGDELRSTKAGESTPATPGQAWIGSGSRRTLNEGRGINPGDTFSPDRKPHLCFHAQRRPGNQPRRHR